VQIWSALFAAAHVRHAGHDRRIGAWVNRRMGVREAGGRHEWNPFWAALASGSRLGNQRLAGLKPANRHCANIINIHPVLFGATLLALWEGITRGFNVPSVLLPPPSMIWERITNSSDILWADFQQTFSRR
jgi:hypothetical protein